MTPRPIFHPMSDVYLRVPVETAKKQLENRIRAIKVETDDEYRPYRRARENWSALNITVLESIFTSAQAANEYRACVKRSLVGGEFLYQTHKHLQDFLRQLASSVEAFPQLPEQELEPTPAASIIGGTQQNSTVMAIVQHAERWEFYSMKIDSPTLNAHIEERAYDRTLQRMVVDGWELVSAVPEFYTKERGDAFRAFTYRLFFKRPSRNGDDA